VQATVVTLAIIVVALAVLLRRERRAHRSAAAESERLRRETAPRELLSRALWSRDAIMAAVAGPVLLLDAEGTVVRANAAARAQAELVQRPAPRELAEAAAACIESGRPQTAEVTVYAPERRRYRVDVRPFLSEHGPGCAVVLTDTSREDDYRDARRLFSAGVSHELRTPLARMLALVDTLALAEDESERAATIEQARAEVDAMRELIDDMILLVRLESHELTGAGERCDLTAAVESAVERHAEAAAARGMALTASATRGLFAAVTARLVDVVLDNLIANAIRHAGEGAHVEVRARGLAGAVELVVADNGAGIAPEHLERVFERFYRVEHARSGPGTGLGLAIVKHIAEEYGGRATAESRLGGGTTMRVVLPAPVGVTTR
jgi:two-component system, OmpR family, sensor histidine kinase SenX3